MVLSADRSSLNVHMVPGVRVSTVVDYLQLPSLVIVAVPSIIINISQEQEEEVSYIYSQRMSNICHNVICWVKGP